MNYFGVRGATAATTSSPPKGRRPGRVIVAIEICPESSLLDAPLPRSRCRATRDKHGLKNSVASCFACAIIDPRNP